MSEEFPLAHPSFRQLIETAKFGDRDWRDIETLRAGLGPDPQLSASRWLLFLLGISLNQHRQTDKVTSEEVYIDSRGAENLRLLVLEPANESSQESSPRPCLLWAHGGGFVIRRPEIDLPFLSYLVEKTGIVVIVSPASRSLRATF
jgi:acetyl esterase/lipase